MHLTMSWRPTRTHTLQPRRRPVLRPGTLLPLLLGALALTEARAGERGVRRKHPLPGGTRDTPTGGARLRGRPVSATSGPHPRPPFSPPGPHSLRYFDTAVSGPNRGEYRYIAAGYVDNTQFLRFDSHDGTQSPAGPWVQWAVEEPRHWDRHTQNARDKAQNFRVSLNNLRGYYNQSENGEPRGGRVTTPVPRTGGRRPGPGPPPRFGRSPRGPAPGFLLFPFNPRSSDLGPGSRQGSGEGRGGAGRGRG